MKTQFCVVLVGCLFALVAASHSVTYPDGEMVRIVDNCTPGNDSTCPDRHCCVKEGLAYIPEYTGPKPDYEIRCSPYRQLRESCYVYPRKSQVDMCPCDLLYVCGRIRGEASMFGHCIHPLV